MGCVLRISGKSLDVEKAIKNLSLKPYTTYKKGEPIFKNKPKGKKLEFSGMHFIASDADFDQIEKQIQDTIKFLNKHKTEIKKITFNKQVEYSGLDFGFYSKVGLNNVAVQSEVFPYKLLKLAGDLKINLEISLY